MMEPKISVIIPVYNSEKYLYTALNSVVDQTYQNLEIIIINNGSNGNVNEIFNQYKEQFSNFEWQLFSFEKNMGVYLAWIKGCSMMTGDYFTFLDSDDRISVDYYYQLINKALLENADIVSTEYVHEIIDEKALVHFPMNDMDLCDYCWKGDDVLKKFFQAAGRTFNYHALWCKIYSYDIWKKSRNTLEKINQNMSACIDPFVTTVFASNSKKWINIHDVKYYHAVYNQSATTTVSLGKEQMKTAFQCVYDCFQYIQDYLVEINRFDSLKEYYYRYKTFFVALMFGKVRDNQHNLSKKELYTFGCNLFSLEKPVFVESLHYLLETNLSPFNDGLEEARKKILLNENKIISFDIFDTLIERPFIRPDDVFEFLSIQYNRLKKNVKYINFAEWRRRAQQIAFKKQRHNNPYYYDITLNDIYNELVYEEILTENEAEKLKEIEINLEERFCKVRRIGKLLYDFALRANKKIICISDMYLPIDVVSSILKKNGYCEIEKIYVSSNEKVLKSDGKLFRKVISENNISPGNICHIGDNFAADIDKANKIGINTIYLPSARDAIMGVAPFIYSGQSFKHIWGELYDSTSSMGFLGTRCMVGLAANKVFNNPFSSFHPESDFDCNPNIIGYYLLGTYVFTIAKWILDRVSKEQYETIHFIARDGYVFKKAYDILASKSSKKVPKSNYLHISRSALMPLLIKTHEDLFALKYIMSIQSLSPLIFLEKMKDIIPDKIYVARESILKEHNIIPDLLFESDEQWNLFIKVYIHEFYDKEKINNYREQFKSSFKKIIGSHDCTFDAGYSARSETLLSEVLGTKIDAFYLYVMEEKGFYQSAHIGMNLEPFHNGWIGGVLHTILETLICSTEGSCNKITFDGNKANFVFEKSKMDSQTSLILNLIQTRAIEFVSDFVQTFPEWEQMCYRGGENAFQYYIYHASAYDKGILQKFLWSDPLCITKDLPFSELWLSTPFVGPGATSILSSQVIGVKGALVNYFRKHMPKSLRPFAKKVKKIIKW